MTPPLKANLKLKELALLQTGETLSPQSKHPNDLVLKLSFSHLDLLVAIENNTKRAFYEMECICGNWSVRELKRQINSFYYERSGLSLDSVFSLAKHITLWTSSFTTGFLNVMCL